jgi:hypothetical protein
MSVFTPPSSPPSRILYVHSRSYRRVKHVICVFSVSNKRVIDASGFNMTKARPCDVTCSCRRSRDHIIHRAETERDGTAGRLLVRLEKTCHTSRNDKEASEKEEDGR